MARPAQATDATPPSAFAIPVQAISPVPAPPSIAGTPRGDGDCLNEKSVPERCQVRQRTGAKWRRKALPGRDGRPSACVRGSGSWRYEQLDRFARKIPGGFRRTPQIWASLWVLLQRYWLTMHGGAVGELNRLTAHAALSNKSAMTT